MTQVGEPIDIVEIVSDTQRHSKSTCPWHEEKTQGQSEQMDEQEGDEDAHGTIPDNSGKTLGRNLIAAGNNPPENDTYQKEVLEIPYKQKGSVAYEEKGKSKKGLSYIVDEEYNWLYDLQYAPHHLIPGNESLKGSKVVPFMGDETAIANYKVDADSRIKDGKSINYDVNATENGVWLPSPYALSMSNEWPSIAGIEAIKKKRKGFDLAESTEDFKAAYVAASIEASENRQFHMRHADYSTKVREILDAMGKKLKFLESKCQVTKEDSNRSGKIDPPYGLKNRLNGLSKRLEGFLIGKVWRAPLFTDDLTKEYAEDLKRIKKTPKDKSMI